MMRISRKFGIYANSKPKYIWDIYDLTYGIDPDTAVTGQFYLTDSYTKKASMNYKATQSMFTLTDAASVSAKNLTGLYIVNTSGSTSSEVSGTYIYRVDFVQPYGYGTSIIHYTRYSSGLNAKGDTKTGQTSSETPDYPIDGIYGDKWYVMMKGRKPQYIWDVYNLILTAQRTGTRKSLYYPYTGMTMYAAKNYTLTMTDYTPTFTLTSPSYMSGVNLASCYVISLSHGSRIGSGSTMYQIDDVNPDTYYVYYYDMEAVSSKGGNTGVPAKSFHPDAYPQDAILGDYWYTYRGYEMVDFDDT